MAPTTDKLRRGVQVGGMSPDRDVVTGGGSYFFTRIKTTGEALRETGFVWRSRMVSRLDAISYHGDAFGKTYNNYPLKNRGSTIEQWRTFATNSRNETNFKNSLSIFDEDNSANEDRWVTLGQLPDGEILVVVHTYKEFDGEEIIRIISARKATKNEIKQYFNNK